MDIWRPRRRTTIAYALHSWLVAPFNTF
jgi:hypothetical protein